MTSLSKNKGIIKQKKYMKKRFTIYLLFILSAVFTLSSCEEELEQDKNFIEIESITINNKVVEDNASITINTATFVLKTVGIGSSFELMVICTSQDGIDTLHNTIQDYSSSYSTSSDSINIPAKTGQYKLIYKELSYGTKKMYTINVTADITDALLAETSNNYFESTSGTKTSGTVSLLSKLGLSWTGAVYNSTTYRLTSNTGVKIVPITETEYENTILQSEIESLITSGSQESYISLDYDANYSNEYLSNKYYAVKNGDFYAVLNFTETYYSYSYSSYNYYSPSSSYKIYFDIKQ